MFDPNSFYDRYYEDAEASATHAAFCMRVYGANHRQHGMADMPQMERLVDVLGLG